MKLSYHDVAVFVGDARYDLFNSPFNLELTCTRVAGWQLWRGDVCIGGEYHELPFRIEIAGRLMCGDAP